MTLLTMAYNRLIIESHKIQEILHGFKVSSSFYTIAQEPRLAYMEKESLKTKLFKITCQTNVMSHDSIYHQIKTEPNFFTFTWSRKD
jgi:hypothetical protein